MSKHITFRAEGFLGTAILLAVIVLIAWLAWSLFTGVLSLTVGDLLIAAALFGIGYLFGRAA